MARKVALVTFAVFVVSIIFMMLSVQTVNVNGLSNLNSKDDFLRAEAIDSRLSGKNAAVPSWSFDTARNWGSFAYVNDYSAQVVIGLDRNPKRIDGSLSRVLEKYGGRIVRQVADSRSIWAIVADVPFDTLSAFAGDTEVSKLVRYIEPNFRFHADFTPNDPDFPYQYGLKKIEADRAWDTQRGSSTVLVAVVDTGLDWNHPDLAANYVPLGYDWVNNDGNSMDDNGHGTHVAGIIGAAINNSVGVAGLAQVRIMAEKALNSTGDGLEDRLANAIIHAVDQGAKIISMSWGDYINSTLIFNAVKYAYDAGVLLTAAAGNNAVDTKMFPAAYDQVIAVTATDSNDNPASFTNFGNWVELAAPGVGIWSTYWSAYSGDTYAPMTGTSMATPFVSGVAALVWSQFPHLTRDQVRMQLRNTADDLGSLGFDDYYGYGRINARKALQAHDVSVTEVKPNKTVIGQGFSDHINVTVANYGTFAEATNVTLYTQLQTDLVGYWKFDDGNGLEACDSSGDGNNATVHGAEWTGGRFGEALSFDGIDDYAEVHGSGGLNITGYQFSISTWVFPRVQHSGSGDVIAKRLGSLGQYFVGWWWNGSHVGFGTGLYNGVSISFAPNLYHPIGIWYHVVSVYNGARLRLYVNGGLEIDQPVVGDLLPLDAPLYFGRMNTTLGDVYFNGSIDDTKIFDFGLSQAQLQAEALSARVQPVTLGVGVSESIAFSWNTSAWVKGNYTVSAYVTPVLGEIWVDDNGFVFGTVCVAMKGDVGGVGVFPNTLPDGKVDMTDLSLIAQIYGVYFWDVRFVSNYDIYRDGRIDIRDLAVAARNFEKVDP